MKTIVTIAALLAATPAAPQHQHADGDTPVLTEPGQGAFAAIQEVVAQLSADPATDWSRVGIERLRQHLIDMEEVMIRARVTAEPVAGGARFTVSGTGRTRDAIRAMIGAHVEAMGETEHWSLSARNVGDGTVVTAIGFSPADTDRIRGLGLAGILAQGAHHQRHHFMLASGQEPHP